MKRLCIDDLRILQLDGEVTYARTPEYGLELLLNEGPWDEVYLDHDMGYHPVTLKEQNIRPVATELERLAFEDTPLPVGKIFIITGNPVAARWMLRALSEYNREIVSHIRCNMLEIADSLDEMHDEWAAMNLNWDCDVMDENKKAKLEEIGYCIDDACGNCRHAMIARTADFGTCAKINYRHLKHTGGYRQLSIHRLGVCDHYERPQHQESDLGGFIDFRVRQ